MSNEMKIIIEKLGNIQTDMNKSETRFDGID
jgi:hypothetical protein